MLNREPPTVRLTISDTWQSQCSPSIAYGTIRCSTWVQGLIGLGCGGWWWVVSGKSKPCSLRDMTAGFVQQRGQELQDRKVWPYLMRLNVDRLSRNIILFQTDVKVGVCPWNTMTMWDSEGNSGNGPEKKIICKFNKEKDQRKNNVKAE